MTIKDNFNLYNVKNFIYHIESGELKGDSLLITSNYDKPSSDKFYFSSAIINLKKNEFIAKDTEIKFIKIFLIIQKMIQGFSVFLQLKKVT